MNRDCNLTKRIRLGDGTTRFCPVVLSSNGRVKPDWVMVDGREEKHPEGAYYIDWHEGSTRRRRAVGRNPQDAQAARLRKEAELNARSHGVAVVPEQSGNGRRSLSDAIVKYLSDIKRDKKPATHAAYAIALEYFQESCRKAFVEDVARDDLLEFASFLRTVKEQSDRSCSNRFLNVLSFLKAQGVRGLVQKNDRPRFVEQEPDVYEQDELDGLFTTCDPDERLLYQFFLMTGMRDQEVMHAYWADVNFTAGTVRVSGKPELGWSPKTYAEREIPIPGRLVDALKVWRKQKQHELVFPRDGRPDPHFLERLKSIAEHAGLDPDRFWLHKFRATFATRSLWAGVDLRTVQHWMGHKDIESTMRYLKPQRGQAVREKVNGIWK
jgi:integrase/recombinase XerD